MQRATDLTRSAGICHTPLLPQCPRHVFTNQPGRVMQSALQRLDDPGAGRRVTESDGQITQPAFVADAANCRALRVMQEFLLTPLKQFDQCDVVQLVSRHEIGFPARAGKTVPGADQLAIVTTIDTVTDKRA